GVLRDEAGKPISGATVVLTSQTVQITSKTGTEGKFRFVNVPWRRYRLSVRWNRGEIVDTELLELRSTAENVEITLSNRNALSVRSSNGESANSGGEQLSSRTVSELPLNKRDF